MHANATEAEGLLSLSNRYASARAVASPDVPTGSSPARHCGSGLLVMEEAQLKDLDVKRDKGEDRTKMSGHKQHEF